MKQYVAVIVLAPGITQTENGKCEFSERKSTFRYEVEGDPHEFRFKAAQKLYRTRACSSFILVGGTVKNKEEILKADVMKDRLSTHYQIPEDRLIPIRSASNTEGNAIEAVRYLSEKNVLFIDGVGLLTNFYHLPRAIKTFIDVANLRLIPISAESVVYDDEFDNIKQFYTSEGCSRILGDSKDSDSEIKGMFARETGSYASRIK